jgi:FkbM family methyltransferase
LSILGLLERLLGRRLMWKLGRRIYLHARREGSLDIETNGERLLQEALARRSAARNAPLTVYDVGANHGQWSRSLLTDLRHARAPSAHLTLFEPIGPIRVSLEGLREEFGDTATIEIVPQAVSDEPGSAEMVFTEVAAGNHHLDSSDFSYDGERVSVEVTTLDLFHEAAGHAFVDMVKIDAEGFDPKVVIGMEGMLRQGQVGVVQIEYSILFVRSRAYLLDLFTIAHRHGYIVALLTAHGFEIHRQWHPDLERFYLSSYVLLRPDSADLLPARVMEYGDDNAHD